LCMSNTQVRQREHGGLRLRAVAMPGSLILNGQVGLLDDIALAAPGDSTRWLK